MEIQFGSDPKTARGILKSVSVYGFGAGITANTCYKQMRDYFAKFAAKAFLSGLFLTF